MMRKNGCPIVTIVTRWDHKEHEAVSLGARNALKKHKDVLLRQK